LAQWDRTTPWRQGHILTDADLRSLFEDIDDPNAVGVVVSHSCDLAQPPDSDPYVEVIIGTVLNRSDGNFSHAKNARRLHLVARNGDGGDLHLELKATGKRPVDKGRLVERGCAPDGTRTLPPAAREILQCWLAARYRRSTFPEEFDRRMNDRSAKIYEKLAKMLTPLGHDIVALFFNVDDGEEVERVGAEDVYRLQITILYTTKENEKAAEVAETLSKEITKFFTEKFWIKSENRFNWIDLDLVECLAITELTYEVERTLKKWNADYISLRSDEIQPIFE
jgi:hypothetical protein